MRTVGGWLAYLTPMVLVAVLAVVLFGCGQPVAAPAATDPPGTAAPAPSSTIRTVTTTAVATMAAEPVVERTTIPADPCLEAEYTVNALPYAHDNPEPAREAYRLTASCRGWSQETIAKWERFIVDDVWRGESSWCPQVRGGAIFAGNGCELVRQGTREDSGALQLVGVWYWPGGPLCEATGMCSSDAIIASPWASINAGLFAVEYDGRGPWSYSAWAKSYHPLWTTVTRYWP